MQLMLMIHLSSVVSCLHKMWQVPGSRYAQTPSLQHVVLARHCREHCVVKWLLLLLLLLLLQAHGTLLDLVAAAAAAGAVGFMRVGHGAHHRGHQLRVAR
jgi:hypothetical protein